MHNTKIEQLLEFLKEDPSDRFTLYALALEYEKTNPEKAHFYFELLLQEHPEYLATYYHAGKFYEKSDKEASRSIYKKGMALALTLRNTKTYNELQNALQQLSEEEYD
ncbi:MAG TPA: hypothetical protein VK766_06780 [Cytophagaceae bacterium]|jgi:hypothetical protein|nr:hypothetical protein [Cytophagaceae bacterium]